MVDTVSKSGNTVAGSSKSGVPYRNGAGRRLRSAQLSPEQERIAGERKRWEGTVASSMAKLPERVGEDQFTTISGMPIERIYTPADLPGFDYMSDLGFPGEYPYTRGV